MVRGRRRHQRPRYRPGHRPRRPVRRQRALPPPGGCREPLDRPRHDPVTGALLGAIDVTGDDHVASPHVLTLVRATVAAVESRAALAVPREQGQRGTGDGRHRPRGSAPRLEVLGRERARLDPAQRVWWSCLRHSELLPSLAEAAVAGKAARPPSSAAECHPRRRRGDRARRCPGCGRLPTTWSIAADRLRAAWTATSTRRPAAGPRLGRRAGALPVSRLARRASPSPANGWPLVRQAASAGRRPEPLLQAGAPAGGPTTSSRADPFGGCRPAQPRRRRRDAPLRRAPRLRDGPTCGNAPVGASSWQHE